MTSPAVTLTVQQLDDWEALLESQSAGGDYAAAMRFAVDAPTAMRALLAEVRANRATVRRQQAALDAVTELADDFESDSSQSRIDGEEARADCLFMVANNIRAALASPAPTEATT